MKVRSFILLLITAIVWGFGFVAQSSGSETIGAFTFTCIRSLLGAAVLVPFILIREKSRKKQTQEQKPSLKRLVFASVCCGTVLAIAQNLQQIGIHYTTVGKAGFITAMYIVLVPILGVFLKKRIGLFVWIGVLFAVAGLYLLNMTGAGEGLAAFSIGTGEIAVLLCALFFAIQIILVDHFLPTVDEVKLAALQFLTCGVVSGSAMFVVEHPSLTQILQAWLPILYAGVCSTGIGYTLQIIGQKGLPPTVSSLVMSMESVFAVVGGFLLLHERLTVVELIGCGLMMIAIVLAQLPQKSQQ
ncbi:MAG: DMT family transporter [Lachnospiraceae bacterium]|nr:DMT family transporter [Lachnospiraceae bacterium]